MPLELLLGSQIILASPSREVFRDHTCPILVLYLISMAWKRYLWSTDLALVTFLRLDDLLFFYFMSYRPYVPNWGCLSHPYGIEEAPVVHRPGPAHLLRLDYLMFNFLSYSPYMPNLGSLSHSHGLEEAPVVHRPGPGHLSEVG